MDAKVTVIQIVDALCDRERRLREALADADSWLIGASFNYKGSSLCAAITELLAAKEGS